MGTRAGTVRSEEGGGDTARVTECPWEDIARGHCMETAGKDNTRGHCVGTLPQDAV